ncbi:MAG: NAD(P)H-hydrate epimerase [Acidobacteria bacterium]|nr:NAD(P)H-hydrate epimerase [Acidobacteriota bacterium]
MRSEIREAGAIARFVAETGIEVPAVTASEMREVDAIAMQETGPNLYQMMENAGRNLAMLAIELLGSEWERATIAVLAGGGGNGGGGICAARHLANRGMNVKLCLAEPGQLADVAAFQRKIFHATSGEEINAANLPGRVDLILDALIGYGLKSAPCGPVAGLIRWANRTGAPVLSLDVPSGLDATTGIAPGECIRARWTLTLALPKTGLLPEKTGEMFLADIGIPEGTYRKLGLNYISPFSNRSWVRLVPR